MLNKLSVKWRITLLTATLLTVACVVLTLSSIHSADMIFVDNANQGGDDVVIIGDPSAAFNDTVNAEIIANQKKFSEKQLISMVLVICVGSALSYFVAGNALKPMTKLSREIKSINEHNLSKNIVVPKSNDEISDVAVSFNQMLAKLNRAFKNQKLFTQNVAHELKTPLASVMANIDVLEIDSNPSHEELLEVVEITKKNMYRLSDIVDDVLELSREIEKSSFCSFDFMELIAEIEEELQILITSRNITVEKIGNLILYGNRSLLHRAFSNLISNAIRYNKEGGKVVLTCEEEKITIADTGMGIPKESLGQIFEPFYCVNPSRSRTLGGSGLGLPMVKAILEKHDMHIEVESEVNVGTKIIISTS